MRDEILGALRLAADDEVAALAVLDREHAAATSRNDGEAAGAASGAAVCIIAPSWGDLSPLRAWCDRLREVLVPPSEPTARLLYLGGLMHCENVLPRKDSVAAPLEGNALELKPLLLRAIPTAAPEVVLVAAEPLLDWFGQAGEKAAMGELATMLRGAVERSDPRIAARSLFWLGNNLRLVDEGVAGEKAFERARAISAETGWYWIRIQLLRASARPAVESRDRARIDSILEEFESLLRPERPLDWGDFHHLRGWDALLSGEARAALQHYRLAVEAAERGSLRPHMASVYRGGVAAALVLLDRADEGAEIYNANRVYETERGAKAQQASVSFARAWHARKRPQEYLAHLREGFGAAREFELVNVFRALPGVMAALCADALEEGIEPDFARKLIAMRKLAPPATASDAWPWPMHARCFGEFALQLGGQPLEFGGKAQNKPLDLVKALAANDNRALPVSRAVELLWPDAEPEAGRKSFDAALMRLRKLVDSNDAFLVDGGKLAVDERRVWSDVRQLNQLAARVEGEPLDPVELPKAAVVLTRIYRATFLANDAETPWVLEARERLKNRFLRAVEEVGRQLEKAGLMREAIHLYDRATEVEPLAEGLYRRLMLAHLAQGSPADAMRVYRRCREMLSILLSIPPSRETQALVERIARESRGADPPHP